MTPEQIRKMRIERYAMLRLITLNSRIPDEVQSAAEEMVSLETALGSTGDQILQERAEGFRKLEEGLARCKLRFPHYVKLGSHDVGAL